MATRPILRPSKAPNLIIARPEYSQEQQELFKNQLRLYFTEVDNAWAAALGPNGLQYFEAPHIAASDSTDQYATANNTPTVINWNTLYSGSGFTLQAPGSAIAQVAGIYKITYSAQLVNTANAEHDAVFWLKVNSVDVPNSATIFTLPRRKSSGGPTYLASYSEATFVVEAGDEVELYWATDLAYNPVGPVDGVYIVHEPAWTVPPNLYERPAVPSVIGSITFVSRRPT